MVLQIDLHVMEIVLPFVVNDSIVAWIKKPIWSFLCYVVIVISVDHMQVLAILARQNGPIRRPVYPPLSVEVCDVFFRSGPCLAVILADPVSP